MPDDRAPCAVRLGAAGSDRRSVQPEPGFAAALDERERLGAEPGEQYDQSLCTEAGRECSLAQEAVGRLRGKVAQLSSRATGTVQRQVLAYLTRGGEAAAEQVALLQDMLACLGLFGTHTESERR